MPPAMFGETQSLLGLYMMLMIAVGPLALVVTRAVVDHRDDRAERSLLAWLSIRVSLAGAVLLAVAILARRPLASALAITSASSLPLLAGSMASGALFLLAQAILFGQMQWRMAAGLPVFLTAARLFLSVALVASGFGVPGVLAAIIVSNTGCFLVAAARAVSGLPRGRRHRPLRLGAVGITGALNAAFSFLVHVDTVYVNRELPELAARGYAAAATLARPVVYLPAVVNQTLFPFLASAAGAAARRAVMLQMAGAAILVGGATIAATLLAPRWLLETTFGPAYAGASGILAPLAAVLVPLAFVNIALYDAVVRHDRALAWTFVLTALAAAIVLATVTPSLTGLFAVLVTSAMVILAVAVKGVGSHLKRTLPHTAVRAGSVLFK
jgi:O-antigen/teichoic acid export membrane protein